MKVTGKKRLIQAAAGILVVLSLAACGGKKVECDFCGEMKTCKTEEIFGEEVHICKDCEKELNDAADALGDLFE